jgi:hypothetical protein
MQFRQVPAGGHLAILALVELGIDIVDCDSSEPQGGEILDGCSCAT